MIARTPRQARTLRAVKQWSEDNDLRGCTLEKLFERAVESSNNVGRDLLPSEVETVCRGAVEAHAVKAERDEKLEKERLAYLRRRAADYKLGLCGAGVVEPRAASTK